MSNRCSRRRSASRSALAGRGRRRTRAHDRGRDDERACVDGEALAIGRTDARGHPRAGAGSSDRRLERWSRRLATWRLGEPGCVARLRSRACGQPSRSARASRAACPSSLSRAWSGIIRAHDSRRPRARRFARFSRRDLRAVIRRSPSAVDASWHEAARRRQRPATERPRHERHSRQRRTRRSHAAPTRARCRRSRGRARSRCRRSSRRPSRRCGRWSTRIAAAATSRRTSIRSGCSRPRASSSSIRRRGASPTRDLDRVIEPTGVHGLPRATLGELRRAPARVYAGSVGLEFMHISSPARRSWLAERMETDARDAAAARRAHADARAAHQRRAVRAVLPHQVSRHEAVLARGQREPDPAARPRARRTPRGSARSRPCSAWRTAAGSRRSSRSCARPARDLFAQFEDIEPEKALGGGDVKYHLGFSTDRVDPNGNAMHVSLAFNPSHLEAVDPVVVGRVRAKQTRHGDVEHRRVLGMLVHGDAAFAGQGLVPETLQLSSLPRLPHRRHGARHRQQPGRLHRVAGGAALDAVLHRRREDARVPDLARQRRGPRRARAGRRDRVRVPRAVRVRRRDRHVLLPQVRPQRERRAGFTQPLHVRADQAPSRRRSRSTRSSCRRGRGRRRRGRRR